MPNDEAKLRAVLEGLAAHGPVLMVVDQPATIGALPVAVAQAVPGVDVAYLPMPAMRIADLHPGSAKTDARNARALRMLWKDEAEGLAETVPERCC